MVKVIEGASSLQMIIKKHQSIAGAVRPLMLRGEESPETTNSGFKESDQ